MQPTNTTSRQGKLIIFSAPSGSGKSTLINYLLTQVEGLSFSISCTSRAPRGQEQHGREYYFLTPEEFRERIARDEFLEYEEVYADKFYGTLKSEVERLSSAGKIVIFDVDVKGGVNIKKYYGDRALSVFIQPPSLEALRERLVGRATDAPEVIETRLERAEFELSLAPQFDRIVVNDDLEQAKAEVLRVVRTFLDAE
jgi:guanylate kinase